MTWPVESLIQFPALLPLTSPFRNANIVKNIEAEQILPEQ